MHPRRAGSGHGFEFDRGPSAPLGDASGRGLEDFEYGADCFNFGYFWEAHEVWEGVWHATPRDHPTRDFLKGMIQVAAALLQEVRGKPEAALRMAQRGLAYVERSGSEIGERVAGLHWRRFSAAVRDHLTRGSGGDESPPPLLSLER